MGAPRSSGAQARPLLRTTQQGKGGIALRLMTGGRSDLDQTLPYPLPVLPSPSLTGHSAHTQPLPWHMSPQHAAHPVHEGLTCASSGCGMLHCR